VLDFDCIEREGSTATAVLLHPHPDMGGDRRHPVIEALHQGLPLTTLRFDFTSSATSVARAEVAEAISLAPDPAVVLFGYSFGADIALTVDDDRLLGWFLIAPPLRAQPEAMVAATDRRPKRLAVPEHDQFSSSERATTLTAAWSATTVETILDADHFLVGRTAPVLAAAARWLPSIFPRP
jgi:uncharacterized protein